MPENTYTRQGKTLRRVVVTGVSAISPLASNIKDTWSKLLKGKSGIRNISSFDSSRLSVHIAGEAQDFQPDDYISKKEQKKMGRFIHLSLACAQMALKDSNLEVNDSIASRMGVLIGNGIGDLPLIEKQVQSLMAHGPRRISPFFIPSVLINLAAGQVSIALGLKGPNYSVTSACASGNHSIGEASRYIAHGQCDIMLAGSSESTVSELGIGGFAAMKALSRRNDEPEKASRPWDQDRDGFILSEGAAILVLEDFEHASRRGAPIYGELTGYGASSDAYHLTAPSPEGEGAALAMHRCLEQAGLNPEDIDYINAHGTSTPTGDAVETMAIKKIFGGHAKKLWISSTKSMTGHALGAAGAIESVFSVMSLKHNVVPPTINLDQPSPSCNLDYVPHVAREGKLQHVLNNSFGFGGTNACLIFSKI